MLIGFVLLTDEDEKKEYESFRRFLASQQSNKTEAGQSNSSVSKS